MNFLRWRVTASLLPAIWIRELVPLDIFCLYSVSSSPLERPLCLSRRELDQMPLAYRILLQPCQTQDVKSISGAGFQGDFIKIPELSQENCFIRLHLSNGFPWERAQGGANKKRERNKRQDDISIARSSYGYQQWVIGVWHGQCKSQKMNAI